MKRKWVLPILLTFTLLVSCQAQQPVNLPDPVTVQLKWVHQAQFAGFYVAESQGYYADENIAVTFIPGGVGVDIYDGVAKGNHQFSVVGADSAIVKRAEGLQVTAIATIYRVNPFVMVAFADFGIISPRDFVGKTVSISRGDEEAQFQAMLSKVGVDPSQFNLVPYTYDDTPFLSGDIDVTVSFAAGSLIPLKERIGDRQVNLIWPGDYGVHFYSDTIITNDELIASNPDLVLRFLRATLKGQRLAVENPETALEASMQYAEVQDRQVQAAMIEASIPLIHTGEDQLGWMRPEVWRGMEQTLREQGILTTPLDISKVYTLRFLQEIYGDAP